MHDIRQVVIAGAGPAGSVLALLLARRGIDVLVLDRAIFPRPKPCGDCLSAEAARLLDRIRLLEAVLACAPAALRGWRIHGPGLAHFQACFDALGDPDPRVQHALALPRSILDAVLLEAARTAGAEVRTGTAVTDLLFGAAGVTGVRVRDDDGVRDIEARLTIGADGLRSRVARRLRAVARAPRIRKLSLTAHCRIERDLHGFGEMHSGRGICVGVAPVSARENLHNVTVVADAGRFGRDVARDPHAFFQYALRSTRSLEPGEIEAGELLASGPFDVPMRRSTFDGAALVGDAAGYFDPFTGQGVFHAMAAAELLAPIAAHALARAGRAVPALALAPYERAHRRLTAPARRVQRLIELVLARPALAAAVIDLLARRPAAARQLLAVTGDIRPARSLLSPAFALALLTPDLRGRP